MTENDADVPYGEDFHNQLIATRWAEAAAKKRPWRTDFFRAFADYLAGSPLPAPRILELGSGPGFLADFVLEHCPAIVDYTLLDFARPMLQLSQERLRSKHPRPRYVCANFKLPAWTAALSGTFDFILSMQAVHELRHKRYASDLYAQSRALLSSGGALVVCDHLSTESSSATTCSLFMTADEHREALSVAGFREIQCLKTMHNMALFSATA